MLVFKYRSNNVAQCEKMCFVYSVGSWQTIVMQNGIGRSLLEYPTRFFVGWKILKKKFIEAWIKSKWKRTTPRTNNAHTKNGTNDGQPVNAQWQQQSKSDRIINEWIEHIYEWVWKLLEVEKRYHFYVWCVSERRVVKTNVCCSWYIRCYWLQTKWTHRKKHQHHHKWAIVNIEVASATVLFFVCVSSVFQLVLTESWLNIQRTDIRMNWKKSYTNIVCMAKWMAAVQLAIAKPRLYYVSISFKLNALFLPSEYNIIIMVICKRSLSRALIWRFGQNEEEKQKVNYINRIGYEQ